MTIDSSRVLQRLAGSLLSGSVLTAESKYDQTTRMGLGGLVMAMSAESDRAADWLVEENAALRELFRGAADAIDDTGLAERVAAAAAGSDPSLRLPDLRATNADLRRQLIALHAHVEGLESDAAAALDAAIWSELAISVRRREAPLG